MNQQDNRGGSATGKFSSTALALAVGMSLAFTGSTALAASKFNPVIIIILKTPSETSSAVPVDASGTFSMRLKESGDYTISTACRSGNCPAGALSLNVAGKALAPDAAGNAGYAFSVGTGGLDVGGQLFVRGAQPVIVNGRSVTPSGTWDDTDIVHGMKIVEIVGNQSPEVLSGVAKPREGGGAGTASRAMDEANTVLGQVSTTRGIATPPGGSESDDGKLPGLAGVSPIAGIPVGLEGDPGSIKVSVPTDANGAFHFDELPPGNYKLIIPGLRDQPLRVGADGIADGSLKRGSDGDLAIFDRWGNEIADAGGDGKLLPGTLRVINNSEIDSANMQTSNRDHIDQDAQTGIKKKTGVEPGGDGNLGENPGGIMVQLNSSGVILATETMAFSKTDSQGNFYFDELPPGNYKLIIPGLRDQPLRVGADGIADGSLKRGSDGDLAIFDRWGNRLAAGSGSDGRPGSGGDANAKKKDKDWDEAVGDLGRDIVGGNSVMGGPGGGFGAGPGIFPPGPPMGGIDPMGPGGGPAGGSGPMGPGASGPMGGPGGAMRP